MADAKRTRSTFLGSTYIGIIMKLSDLWWQYWSEIQKSRALQFGFRSEVCPEIGKICRTYFRANFRTLFELILRPLSGLSCKNDRCRTEELRLGCFSIRLLNSFDIILIIQKMTPFQNIEVMEMICKNDL